jgi:hypothetical protein
MSSPFQIIQHRHFVQSMKTPEDEAFEEIERIQRTRTRWVPVPKPLLMKWV